MGPLAGYRIIEVAGIGPSQFCGMLLADMGADVIRIERAGDNDVGVGIPAQFNLMNRGRTVISLDLKSRAGVEHLLALCGKADALFEGFRPGVMERLGLGPDDCRARNERLVYGRITGWGRDGPLAQRAGHDGNYSALTGVISAIGEKDGPPSIPLNLAADFGGGGTYLAIGLLAALIETGKSGKGQVVDTAMVDGAASLMTAFYGLHAGGFWNDKRGSNLLDGGAPFYRVYRTSDDRYVIVCALERRFFRELLDRLSIDDIDPNDQHDVQKWPQHIASFEAVFAGGTRDHWCSLLEQTDACFAPVLSLSEAPRHPHNEARDTFVELDGIVQPAPTPRFSRTESVARRPPSASKNNIRAVLQAWDFGQPDIDALANLDD